MIIGGYTLNPEHGRLQIPLVRQPSLEDVFVHYVKEKRREVAA